ncbi:MAG: SRPBCC family protein [Actinobacteria bacterium]|nr:SRPBCC family protein [Actinomycetota bacterium]
MADTATASITVAAPPAAIMAVIGDFAAYPEWASGVRAADVVARDSGGLASRVRFQLDAGPVKDAYVLGYRWDGTAGVRWDLAEPGTVVSGMTGGYELAEQGADTKVTYHLAVDIRIPMPGILKRRAEKMIIDAALKGLKKRAEARGGEQR